MTIIWKLFNRGSFLAAFIWHAIVRIVLRIIYNSICDACLKCILYVWRQLYWICSYNYTYIFLYSIDLCSQYYEDNLRTKLYQAEHVCRSNSTKCADISCSKTSKIKSCISAYNICFHKPILADFGLCTGIGPLITFQ